MDRNRFVNLALTYEMDDEGNYLLTPMFQTTRHVRPAGRGIGHLPFLLPTHQGWQDGINFDDLSPLDVNLSCGGRLDETFLAGADFHAKPADAVKVNAAYRYFTYDTDVNQYAPDAATLAPVRTAADPKSWTVQRRQTKSLTERFNHGFDVNASYDHSPPDTTFWKNLTQVGFNARITGTDRSASFRQRRQPERHQHLLRRQSPLRSGIPTWSWWRPSTTPPTSGTPTSRTRPPCSTTSSC